MIHTCVFSIFICERNCPTPNWPSMAFHGSAPCEAFGCRNHERRSNRCNSIWSAGSGPEGPKSGFHLAKWHLSLSQPKKHWERMGSFNQCQSLWVNNRHDYYKLIYIMSTSNLASDVSRVIEMNLVSSIHGSASQMIIKVAKRHQDISRSSRRHGELKWDWQTQQTSNYFPFFWFK